jgi:very-short-patch-repair endonuclease
VAHIHTHNISTKDYYDKFIKKENEGKCKRCNKETKFASINSGYQLFCSRSCSNKFLSESGNNWSSTNEGREFHRSKLLKSIQTQYNLNESPTPCISPLGRDCLDLLENRFNHKILREVNIHSYTVDGIIDGTNIIIEFDGRHNFKDNYITLTDYDIKRQQEIETYGYRFFRVKRTEWIKDPELIINQFKGLIECLKESQLEIRTYQDLNLIY